MRKILLFFVAVAVLFLCPLRTLADNVERVSVASDGTAANADSDSPEISQNGRYVVFTSAASNLVAGDSNSYQDVFLHDRVSATTERVSIAYDGSQAFSASFSASVSGNGEWVVFVSMAANLVPGDSNGVQDIFVRDRDIETTKRISIDPGAEEPNNSCSDPVISSDGRFVAYVSAATNLVSGDNNSEDDVFIYDRLEGVTDRVSLSSSGSGDQASDAPSVSSDGNYVAFQSDASNLVNGDTNGFRDIFIRDRESSDTVRISKAFDGSEANGHSSLPAVSADGRFVAFYSDASNLVPSDTNGKHDVFVYDRLTDEMSRVSVSSDGTQAVNDSRYATISGEGNIVTFWSVDRTLAPGGVYSLSDVYVHDRTTGITKRMSQSLSNTNGDDLSWHPVISGDGNYITFHSSATNLVSGDTNLAADVFVAEKGSTAGPTPTPTATPTPTSVPVPIETKDDEEIREIIKEKINPIVRGDTPVVKQQGKKIIVTFLEYEIVLPDGTAKEVAAALEEILNEIELAQRGKGKLRLRYRIKLKQRGAKRDEVKKRTSRKNEVAYKRLKPDNYRVRYRVEVARRGDTVAKTRYSKPASFRVER